MWRQWHRSNGGGVSAAAIMTSKIMKAKKASA